jgi:conjugal transfer pilus assembly protein TraA
MYRINHHPSPAGASPTHHPALLAGLMAAAAVALPLATAHAGAGGAEFDPFYDTIVDWAQGSLGKALALAMFLVGIGMGVVRGSVIAAVPSVAGALGLFIAPTIIDAIVTATLTGETVAMTLPAVESALARQL